MRLGTPRSLGGWLATLLDCRRGSVATIAALAAVPLIIAVGSSVDAGRVLETHAQLQDIADAGALAGATQMGSSNDPVQAATNFVNAAVSRLPGHPNVSGSYSYDSSAYTVKVVLTSAVSTTFGAVLIPTVNTSAQSLATGVMVRNVTVTLTQMNTTTPDVNTITYYTLPAGQSGTALYQQTPTLSPANLIYSNAAGVSNPTTTSFQVPIGVSVYFALSNKTGAYGQNCYGQAAGTSYVYYSHREDSVGSYWDYNVPAFTACTTGSNYWTGTVPSGGVTYLMNCSSADAWMFGYIGGSCQSSASYPAGAYVYYADSNTAYQGYDPYYGSLYSKNPLHYVGSNIDCTQGDVQYQWDGNGLAIDQNGFVDAVFKVNCQKLVVQQSSIRLLS